MLNNVMIIPPNLNEKVRDMWISKMFNLRFFCDLPFFSYVLCEGTGYPRHAAACLAGAGVPN